MTKLPLSSPSMNEIKIIHEIESQDMYGWGDFPVFGDSCTISKSTTVPSSQLQLPNNVNMIRKQSTEVFHDQDLWQPPQQARKRPHPSSKKKVSFNPEPLYYDHTTSQEIHVRKTPVLQMKPSSLPRSSSKKKVTFNCVLVREYALTVASGDHDWYRQGHLCPPITLDWNCVDQQSFTVEEFESSERKALSRPPAPAFIQHPGRKTLDYWQRKHLFNHDYVPCRTVLHVDTIKRTRSVMTLND